MAEATQAGYKPSRRLLCVAIGINITFIILTFAAFSVLRSALAMLSWRPPSKVPPQHTPNPDYPLPGFGFDLGSSYIAASVRYSNETFQSFVFANVTEVYQNFFAQASLGRERYRGDWPEVQSPDTIRDIWPREDPGHRPANDIIANAIGKVRDSIEMMTGLKIDKAIVSNQKLPALM